MSEQCPYCDGRGGTAGHHCIYCGGSGILKDDEGIEEPYEPHSCSCLCGCHAPVAHYGDKCGMCREACFCGTYDTL